MYGMIGLICVRTCGSMHSNSPSEYPVFIHSLCVHCVQLNLKEQEIKNEKFAVQMQQRYVCKCLFTLCMYCVRVCVCIFVWLHEYMYVHTYVYVHIHLNIYSIQSHPVYSIFIILKTSFTQHSFVPSCQPVQREFKILIIQISWILQHFPEH